jgi:hypothetical protein
MLRGFLDTGAAHLAMGGNAHELQPGFDWETLVEGEPNEGMERCKVYYKGGRWWVPPSSGHGEPCVSVLPVARPSTKGVPTMH